MLPTEPVLEALIKDAQAHRPELLQAEAESRAERERIPQASALPDPMLSVGIQNDSFSAIQIGEMETSYLYVMGSQTFPFPGKRGLREEVAATDAELANAQLSRVQLATEADVRRAWTELLLVRERRALLEELRVLFTQASATAKARYEAGEGAQSDLLRAQLELTRIEQRVLLLSADETVRLHALNRFAGRPLASPIATGVALRELPLPSVMEEERAVRDALERSPELQGASLFSKRSDGALALARKDALPDLTVTAGVMPRGGLPPMWTAGLSVPLPVFAGSKQSRAVEEQTARKDAAARSAEAVRANVELRARERASKLRALTRTLQLFRETLLVQSRATAESTLSQYAVGRVTFASVVEALAGYVSDEEAFVTAMAEAQQLLIADAEVSLQPASQPESMKAPRRESSGGGR